MRTVVSRPSEVPWDDIDAEACVVVQISPDHETPEGVARNALTDRFTVLSSDADWVLLHTPARDAMMYLDTLGIEYECEGLV